jgi:hypothetical protein
LAEILDEAKLRAVRPREWIRSSGRAKPDSRMLDCYFRREKHLFASYHPEIQTRCVTRVRFIDIREGTARQRSSPAPRVPITSRGYVQTVQTLIELLELPGGWNSYKAIPIRKENVNCAVELLARLMRVDTPAPNVVPKVRGGVQLEWHTRGVNLEIAIDSPNDVTFFAEDIRADEEPMEEELNESTLARWIDRISE